MLKIININTKTTLLKVFTVFLMTSLITLYAHTTFSKINNIKATKVQAVGQAAIIDNDNIMARDKAIADALRKAIEQAVGTMVTSETLTQNFELISDRIYSKAKGYVRSYKIMAENKNEGVYQVTIEANVAAGNLHNDLDGLLAVLKTKNMPRVLVMVAEQNVGQAGADFWWGNSTFSTNLDVVDNTFVNTWRPKGLKFIDRQALNGKLTTSSALTSAEPSDAAVKEFAAMAGAELVIIGKAVAIDTGPVMDTKMHSIRANISVRTLNLDTGEILCTSMQSLAVAHIDPVTGGTLALQKVAQRAADDLLQKITAQWERHTAGPMAIKLVLKNITKMKQLRTIKRVLSNKTRGVVEVRQRLFKAPTAELEIEYKGSVQDLADALESAKFEKITLAVDEITANTVVVVLK
ncbi:MAG: flagellar assembly protein T N-terminal domain-containing protein [Deltaproteobacteria bacterium]|nr:flagellar assembly protein T N-terminal domain-containing protein [Deltaproteobacteria bacterium]